ncbi:hypothetical protein ACJX0J_009052, partial [Zea mays]
VSYKIKSKIYFYNINIILHIFSHHIFIAISLKNLLFSLDVVNLIVRGLCHYYSIYDNIFGNIEWAIPSFFYSVSWDLLVILCFPSNFDSLMQFIIIEVFFGTCFACQVPNQA